MLPNTASLQLIRRELASVTVLGSPGYASVVTRVESEEIERTCSYKVGLDIGRGFKEW